MYRSFIIAFLLFIGTNAHLQINTNSPYSSQGIGDVRFYGDAYTSALGGASVALTDSSQVNIYNPATYSFIARQLPLFSLGINHYEKEFSDLNHPSVNERFTGITQMSLAVPFGKRFGLAFGLEPFSRTGYEVNQNEVVQGDTVFYDYTGKGDVYNAFVGFAANVINTRRHTLSVGTNVKFLFGKINRDRRTYKIVGSGREVGGKDEQTMRARGVKPEIGLSYNYRPTPEHSFRLAGVYRPGMSSKFETSNVRYFYGDYYSQNSYDTIVNIEPEKAAVFIPSKTTVGFTYQYLPQSDSMKRRSKQPSYLLTFEYGMENWGEYTADLSSGMEENVYHDATSLRLGFEFSPHHIATDRSSYIKFFDRLKYRVGGYMLNTPFAVGGEQLKDRGVTLGFGIPILLNRAVSTVNISGSYGVLGDESIPNSVRERYFGINLGINIAPGYDRWFRKYKLD